MCVLFVCVCLCVYCWYVCMCIVGMFVCVCVCLDIGHGYQDCLQCTAVSGAGPEWRPSEEKLLSSVMGYISVIHGLYYLH